MKFETILANNPEFIDLLETENLPTEDLAGASKIYFGLRDNGNNLVAAGGLEICGVNALIRSCAVAGAAKRQGLGARLVADLVSVAREKHLNQLFLLTETASGFFQKLGFSVTDRDTVPVEIAGSAQFSEICPQSVVAMMLRLDVSPEQD